MDGSFSWVPDGMDSSSATRIDVRVCAYAEFSDTGTQVWHSTRNQLKVLDRDFVNFKDFSEELDQEIKHGVNQKLLITFWDKVRNSFAEINHDTLLLTAIDMYWDERRLPIMVSVVCKEDSSISSCDRQLTTPLNPADKPPQQKSIDNEHDSAHSEHGSSSSEEPPIIDDWVDAEIEYIGVDDESEYKELLTDSDESNQDDRNDSDDSFQEDLAVDDMAGCETIVHVTDFENPKIEVGVTFEDGNSFKKAIRQYAVKGEYEIAAPYSESTRYRGYCKAKSCKWRIHASQLQDGRTWQIKKMPKKHNCGSTGTVEKNCMANNHWVCDRVMEWLSKDASIGPTELRKKLEENYKIKISNWVVWDGKEMALKKLQGDWDASFEDAFSFKAELERTNPGSIVDIEFDKDVEDKHRFTRMFVALRACVDGFLYGCRPYLGVDSTALTGKWRGQLASAIAIDGNNWMFPVAYGVFGSETSDNWAWFFDRLHMAIGSPPGLVISTDAGKGIDAAVTQIFTNGVEHRECMRHLVKNFMKKFRGEVFLKHLWPACRAFRILRFEQHYNPMLEACPEAIQWLEDNHKHMWKRYQFSEISKVDYVTNNIAESFNSWIRKEKSLPVIPLFDRIRQMIMEKMDLRRRISYKLRGEILPRVVKDVNAKSRGLPYIHRFSNRDQDNAALLAEVQGVDKDLQPWRHTLDLTNRTCTCRQWQVTGLPCYHAVHVITSMRNPKIEDYIDDYYSVHKFKKAYENYVGPMTDRCQWPKVDLGFKLWPPVLKRAAGRPRTRRYKGWEEGGTTRRTVTCKRCHQKGHMKKTCNETVLDPNAPPPAPPKPKRVRNKSKKAIEVQPQAKQIEAPSPQIEATSLVIQTTPLKASTPAMDISSPITRSRQRQLDLDSAAIRGMCTPTKQLPSTIDNNSPMTRNRKKQLDAAMHKASKVAAKTKTMKKTARKLDVKKAKR